MPTKTLPTSTPTPIPSPTPGISPEALVYLNEVMDIVQEEALNRDKINWDFLTGQTLEREKDAVTPDDAYGSVIYMVEQLKDNTAVLWIQKKQNGSAIWIPAMWRTLLRLEKSVRENMPSCICLNSPAETSRSTRNMPMTCLIW